MMHSAVVVVLYFATAIVAVTSGRLCVPEKYELKWLWKITELKLGGKPTLLDARSHGFTDYNQLKSAIYQELYTGGKLISNLTFIIDMHKNVLYQIDTGRKECISLKYTGYSTRLCNDDKRLEHIDTLFVDHVFFDLYRSSYREGNTYVNSTITMERSYFTPISQAVTSVITDMNFYQFSAIQFGNMTAGISDPSVFDVPSYCNTDKPSTAPLLHGWKHPHLIL